MSEEMEVEYAMDCSCGKGLRLELTLREQRKGYLNPTTQIIANLFEHFHGQHGAVKGGFALKDDGVSKGN